MKWHAVVPVKMLSQGKMRLAGVLRPDERRQLVVTMLQDVTRALDGVAEVTHRSVITSDPSIVPPGWQYIEDPGLGLNGALQNVTREQDAKSDAGLLVLPGDLPFVTSGEISDLTAAHHSGVLAIAPDWATWERTDSRWRRPQPSISVSGRRASVHTRVRRNRRG